MNRIKELRTEQGMTQQELAAAVGVVRTTISNYENGINQLDPQSIRRICGVFECTADYLLGLSEVRKYAFTVQEYAIIAAYRVADEDDRAVVDHALKKYMKKEKPAERA